MPDNAVIALVPKQVTAYNSVNNSTVSRTSASKYGKRRIYDMSEILLISLTSILQMGIQVDLETKCWLKSGFMVDVASSDTT